MCIKYRHIHFAEMTDFHLTKLCALENDYQAFGAHMYKCIRYNYKIITGIFVIIMSTSAGSLRHVTKMPSHKKQNGPVSLAGLADGMACYV